ncbi:hypothetical protein [Ehrlichia ruminantium]|uniref:hypothetical protein n=1 Tax=Ehrlichia ruminantium TaxID=779 RepID=UPI001E5F88BA|nr:hypothetical protein [Ehrlichia ruminantium]
MLSPSKLKIKKIHQFINKSHDLKKLRYVHVELKKLKQNLYKCKNVSRSISKKKYIAINKRHLTLNTVKKDIKVEIRSLLMSTIAHQMDPTQRAGQTITSNIRDAKKFGRGSQAKKKSGYKSKKKINFLKLLNLLLKLILPVPSLLLDVNLIIYNITINDLKKTKYKNHNNDFRISNLTLMPR